MALSSAQRDLREQFINTFGYWDASWEAVLVADTQFFEAYLSFAGVPWHTSHLEPKVKELIHIAIDGAATHLFAPGLRQHIRNALDRGASSGEVIEVLELTSALGIHACTVGMPILIEEMGNDAPKLDQLTARQEQLKSEFIARRGYWNIYWATMLALDADFFSAYATFSGVPWEHGKLEPKIKEFIYTAFDVAATHLYEPGLRQHIHNALNIGATAREIVEVFQIASTLGIHACYVGMPILVDELAKSSGPPIA